MVKISAAFPAILGDAIFGGFWVHYTTLLRWLSSGIGNWIIIRLQPFQQRCPAVVLLVLWLVVQNVLDIEAAVLGERPPYLIGLQHLHVDVQLRGLGGGLRPLGLGELYGRLLCFAQAPQRLKGWLDSAWVLDASIIQPRLRHRFEQGTDIFLEHPLLDTLDEIIVVFQVAFAGGVFP